MSEVGAPGRNLGPYRLVRQIGSGGFAPVWLAREVYGDVEVRTVAVKLFEVRDQTRSGFVTASSPQRDKIFEEARALSRVEHPNIVRFYAIATDTTESVLGLVMEHLQGKPLDVRIGEAGKLTAAVTLEIGAAVASALSAAHRAGVVHRDVKPHNVVEADGVYKLIDFGISAAEGSAAKKPAPPLEDVLDDLPFEPGDTAEATRFVLGGTVGYVDPATIVKGDVTPSADLYSLGAMLFECLTGKVPAVAAAAKSGKPGLSPEVLDGRARPPKVRELAADAPEALGKLIDALLDPDRDSRPRSAEAVAWELERIRLAAHGAKRALPAEDVGPFRGLGRFESADRDVYFGRTTEIAASLELLRGHGMLAIVGASGSGKSSLARAGVEPAVRDAQLGAWPKDWDTVVLAPGVDPAAALRAALAPRILPPAACAQSPEALVAALSARVHDKRRGVLLVVDQLEELVTLECTDESRAFLAAVLARIGAGVMPGVRAAVAFRRDLLDELVALPGLGRALTRGMLLVAPMSKTTWGEVIDQALAAYGYELEDAAMREELLGELEGTVEAMPLVQFALTEMWKRRDRTRHVLPRAALTEIGGVAGALDMHAERARSRVEDELGPERVKSVSGVPLVYAVAMALTTPTGTRAIVLENDLARLGDTAAVETVVRVFEEERLFVREGGRVTLAHEALLAQWRRLRAWTAAAREDRLLLEELERDAQAWSADRSVERLWRGGRLVAARELVANSLLDPSKNARDFVSAGHAAALRGRRIAAAAGAIALLVVGIVVVAYLGSIRAAQAGTEDALRRAEDERARAEGLFGEAERARGTAEQSAREKEDARAELEKEKRLNEDELARLEARVDAAKSAVDLKRIQRDIAARKGRDPVAEGAEPEGPRGAASPSATPTAVITSNPSFTDTGPPP